MGADICPYPNWLPSNLALRTSHLALRFPDSTLREQRATFRRHLETSSYGMRDCEVLDCCGNRIGLGQPT
jgi:hypothetical protein